MYALYFPVLGWLDEHRPCHNARRRLRLNSGSFRVGFLTLHIAALPGRDVWEKAKVCWLQSCIWCFRGHCCQPENDRENELKRVKSKDQGEALFQTEAKENVLANSRMRCNWKLWQFQKEAQMRCSYSFSWCFPTKINLSSAQSPTMSNLLLLSHSSAQMTWKRMKNPSRRHLLTIPSSDDSCLSSIDGSLSIVTPWTADRDAIGTLHLRSQRQIDRRSFMVYSTSYFLHVTVHMDHPVSLSDDW